jgi:hypothetical protein
MKHSDDQILIGNRDYWEILDEELEEMDIYIWSDSTKKENQKLYLKLIKFCKKHFKDYHPNYKEDC